MSLPPSLYSGEDKPAMGALGVVLGGVVIACAGFTTMGVAVHLRDAKRQVSVCVCSVCCSVVQCCSVLQRVAVCCDDGRCCAFVRCEVLGLYLCLQCVFAVLKCVTACEGVNCVAVYCSVLQGCSGCSVLYCVAVCCSVLQRAALCCIVWQCVAVCCSVTISF